MLHRTTAIFPRAGRSAPPGHADAGAPLKASANVSRFVVAAAITLVLLIPAFAPAQDYRAPVPGGALPTGTTVPLPDGTRQHYVGPHFDAQGRYVPPHYEGPKKPPFRGYYQADEVARAAQKQHGYAETPPDYTTPNTTPDKPMEGR